MSKNIIHSDNAPAAIGAYSQAVRAGNTVYLSGQIPLDPKTMALVSDQFAEQAHQVFKNLKAVCEAAGGSLNDIVKINAYLTDILPSRSPPARQWVWPPCPAMRWWKPKP